MFRGGIQYLYLVVTSRVLGPESFGLYMLGFTVISFAEVVGRIGLDLSATRFVSLNLGVGDSRGVRSVVGKTLALTAVSATLVAAFLFVSADRLWARAFDMPELGPLLRLLSLSVPFLAVMAVALAATQGFQVMKYAVYSQAVFHPSANLAFASIFYAFGSRLEGAVHAWLLASLLASILSLHFLRRLMRTASTTESRRAEKKSTPTAGDLLGHSSPLVLIIFLTSLLMWTDTLMLGYFRSENEVGIYSAALRTAMLIGLILLSFNTVFAPRIADLHNRNETARLDSLLKLTGRWIYSLTVPFFLLLVLLPEDVMRLFGASFGVGKTALAILAIGQFVNASTGPVGTVLVMTGHQRIMLLNSAVVFLFNIASNYALIPQYGMTGAAIASAASIALYNLAMLAEVYYFLHMHPYSRMFLRTTVAGLSAAAAFYGLLTVYPSVQPVRIAIYAPLFLAGLFLLLFRTCWTDEDRETVAAIKARTRPASIS
jgi:O-antigen/teichoic acid export membrane protein